MEERKTKIKSFLIIVLAWLIAIALVYIVFLKIKILNSY